MAQDLSPLEALTKIVDDHYIDNEDEELDIIEKSLKAFGIAKKVFKCNSLYEHHIDSAYESGWITKEEYNLLKEALE